MRKARNWFVLDVPPDDTKKIIEEHAANLSRQIVEGSGPDRLRLYIEQGEVQLDGHRHTLPMVVGVPTIFFPIANTIRCLIGGKAHTFELNPNIPDLQKWLGHIERRNKTASLALPDALKPQSREQDTSPLIAQAPNSTGDRDLHLGLAHLKSEGAWLTNGNEASKYFRGENYSVIYQPPEILVEAWWAQAQEETLTALDQRFASIRNDMTADIIDVMFHHWNTHKQPDRSGTAVEKASITLRKICEYRNITADTNNIGLVYLCMRDVRAFRLKGGSIEQSLFDIATVDAQPTLWEQDASPHADTAFIYSPGFFLARAVQGAPIYLAPFMRRVWELNPNKHAHAKRLARYLRSEWRLNTQKYLREPGQAPARFRTWANILTDSGINFEGYEATKDPKRFREGIEDALSTLYDLGAISECGKRIYHPEDLPVYENLPRRGAFALWLNLRVCIEPPAEVYDALRQTDARRRARAEAQAQALPEGKKPTPKSRKPRS